MLIIFTVKDQKVTHDLGKRTLVAGSSGIVQAAFTFDSSWDGLSIVVVFSNSAKKCSSKPVKYSGEPIDIPPETLVAGKLYVSVIGFGDSDTRKTTQKWDVQQAITVQPSISGFALSGAKAVEAGTKLASVNYTAGTLNPGSYQYGPETGVVASNWVVQRITDKGTVQISGVNAASLSAGSDDNDGDGFTIGDVGGENVFASLKYKAVATHGAGVTAKDNLGDDSNPPVSIAAGEKEKATSAYTPYRNYFSGATTSKPTLDSAYIRGLTKSNKPYAAGTLTINVAAGTQRVCIACLASKTGVTKVINETAMNADVTSTFTQSTVDVEGAEGYTAQSYKVWVFEPAVPYENAAVLKVTLG